MRYVIKHLLHTVRSLLDVFLVELTSNLGLTVNSTHMLLSFYHIRQCSLKSTLFYYFQLLFFTWDSFILISWLACSCDIKVPMFILLNRVNLANSVMSMFIICVHVHVFCNCDINSCADEILC